MATVYIDTQAGFQGGRASDQAADVGKSFLRFAGTLTTDLYSFQFPQASGSTLTFGIPRMVFIDNALNNFTLTVTVLGSLQAFPVPANSTGWFPLDAQASSQIEVQSAGASSGIVEFIFYNYDRAEPFVYYKFGAATTAVTIADGADAALGAVADAAETNPAASATAIALLKGLLTVISGGVSGTAVTIADGADVALGDTGDAAVTNPASTASAIALLKGLLTLLASIDTDTGNIATSTSTTATNTGLIETSVDAVNTTLGTTNTNTGNTATSVASIDTKTTDLVTNTNALSYNNITTSTTTVVKNAPGVVGKITVNTAGGAGTIILYDNTAGSGVIIATLDSTVIGSFEYNVNATIGITVVTTGAPDVTVTYR